MIKRLFKCVVMALALASVAGAVYYKVPEAREWVDARFPQVKIQAAKIIALVNPAASKVAAKPEAGTTDSTPAPVGAGSVPRSAVDPTPPVVAAEAAPPVQPGTVDLVQLSQSRANWPKAVALKKSVTFPAVLDGKVVGSVKAPPGTLVHLVMMKESKVGLEYQGGGAMVEATDTDLIDRVAAARSSH